MANACPIDHEAIRQVEEVLKAQLPYDASIKMVINRIDEGEGMLLRSGKRLQKTGGKRTYTGKRLQKTGGKRLQKTGGKRRYTGGMFDLFSSTKRPAEDTPEKITPGKTPTILNGLAHIITASIFASVFATGATYAAPAVTCYLNPIVKAYLTTWGWLPTLCVETPASLTDPASWLGAISWGMQELIGQSGFGDSCSMIKENYLVKTNMIKLVVKIFAGLVSGGVGVFKRATLKAQYMAIKDMIYFVLETLVTLIATAVNVSTTTVVTATYSFSAFFKDLMGAINKKLTRDRSLTPAQREILASFGQAIELDMVGPNIVGPNIVGLNMVGTDIVLLKQKDASPEPRERTPTPEELMPGSRPATEEPSDEVAKGGRKKTRTMKNRTKKRKRTMKKRLMKNKKK